MKTIDLVGIMKTVASVTPLESENEFLVKYGNHKQVVIVVKEAAQPARAADETICHCLHDVYDNVVNSGHCMACGKPFRR